MRVFHYSDVKPEKVTTGMDKATIRWLVTKETGAKRFAMRMVDAEPGADRAPHHHPWEHEVLILEGHGTLRKEDGDVPIEPGTVLFIDENEPHTLANTGDTVLKYLCVIPYLDGVETK